VLLSAGSVDRWLLSADAGQAGPSRSPAPPPAALDGRAQARSMVISPLGIVASEHPYASQAGAMVLAAGGSAIDAAIAANAVTGVVAPHMNGIGGDLFAIVYEAGSGRLYGLNASGWSGSGLTMELVQAQKLTRLTGVHSVTVPGAVAGWQALHDRFGRLPLADVLAPAIKAARDGFPVTEWTAGDWASHVNNLQRDANAARTYLPDGRAPAVGQIFRNPDLAWSLERLATIGTSDFYRGEIAARIVDYLERHGGTITAADMADYAPEWIDPVSTTYRGWTVYELPPNGVGIAALEMLNIVERYPMTEWGHNSVEALHALIEAKKLAYADISRYVADPAHSRVPTATLISKPFADTRAALVDADRANCDVPAATMPASGGDTIYLSAVDAEGNIVSLIQSNYGLFGSRLVPDGVGFVLHNRGALFSTDPEHPNAAGPRKRPQHTIIPAFMSRGDVKIAFGIMGGWNQSQAHAQFVSNIVDHGMNIQAAMEAARFNMGSFAGCSVAMEQRVPASVRAALESMGHVIQLRHDYSDAMGGGQAVMRDFATGVNYGASDPRKDGAAIPQPLLLP
jgi:gamma-glutamyltranspeptidase/glutathione hydrolase